MLFQATSLQKVGETFVEHAEILLACVTKEVWGGGLQITEELHGIREVPTIIFGVVHFSTRSRIIAPSAFGPLVTFPLLGYRARHSY